MNKGSLAFVLLVAAGSFAPAGSPAQDADYSQYVSPWKTPWDYEGARGAGHWSALDPAYALCNVGKQQSPIDIRSAQRTELAALRFEYHSAPLRYVINNGHTIRVDYHDPAGSGNFPVAGAKRYQLTQFHFHRPSEACFLTKPATTPIRARRPHHRVPRG